MITFTMLYGYVVCLFLAILAGIILWMIWTEKDQPVRRAR
jgi:hypothetical protein